ncbi:VirB6/TrbL-like conjugal transfer protein, CD1112 family [Butyrivibrio sp. VCB2006]|uniref:VirB6/TrbL-like conjugal transfer protein, CD1112 family n=1 Tax=Butyrivibrio sp. VCB2006 TaxID=1280679 RepID=UPI0004926606|nr:CD0415/CD1112 family protein [Butyrivibrio sp. VCB2006]
MEWLSNYFQAMFLEMLKGAANDFFEALSGLTGDVRGLIDVNPGTYDATLFTMIRRISDTAIVPVACLILCYLMTINFIKIIEDKNTYKDMTFMPVFKWILYTTIGIVLVTKTYDIVLAIFDVVGWILAKAGAIITLTEADINLQDKLNELIDLVDPTDIGKVLGMTIQLMMCKVLVSIVAVLCKVAMYFRIISILVYSSAAAIPMATLMDQGQNQTGQNYLKNLASLGLQGFFTLIIIAIFEVLISELATRTDLTISTMAWSTLMYTLALCMGLFSTKKVADVTLGAH